LVQGYTPVKQVGMVGTWSCACLYTVLASGCGDV